MSLTLSALPTPAELAVLDLLTPDSIATTREGARLVLTFTGLASPAALVRFVFSPTDPARGLSGALLPELVEALGEVLATSCRVLRDAEAHPDVRINDILVGTEEAIRERLGAAPLTLHTEPLTFSAEDWFGRP